jgi:hypothetical protein
VAGIYRFGASGYEITVSAHFFVFAAEEIPQQDKRTVQKNNKKTLNFFVGQATRYPLLRARPAMIAIKEKCDF